MTRKLLLQHLVHQAHANGFAFRHWFRAATALPWTSAEDALAWLSEGSRAHLLLFSHTFARAFFRGGERLRYIQPSVTYQRLGRDGTPQSIQRRAHSKRSNRDDTWRYHLREMAAAPEPLRYIRRFLLFEETLAESNTTDLSCAEPQSPPTELTVSYDDELLVQDEPPNSTAKLKLS